MRVFPIGGLLRFAFAALVLGAVGRQLGVHLHLAFSVVNFFSYFTNLANLFAACVFLAGARAAGVPGGRSRLFDTLRLINVANMAVVGIVFSILLRKVDLGHLLPWVNVVVHYVMPIAVMAEWMIWPPRRRLDAADWSSCQILPIVFLAYTMARGRVTGWHPYPFLRPELVGGEMGVLAYVAAIVVVFLGASGMAVGIANARAAGAAGPA